MLADKAALLLPLPLVIAAVLSQFSAAVADTLAGSGNTVEATHNRVDMQARNATDLRRRRDSMLRANPDHPGPCVAGIRLLLYAAMSGGEWPGQINPATLLLPLAGGGAGLHHLVRRAGGLSSC